jgi:hypothetical protein
MPMRKMVVLAVAAALAVGLLILSAIAAVRLAPLMLHMPQWMKLAPLAVLVAAMPAIVRRVRTRGFFNVEL